MKKRYIVELTLEERQTLEKLIHTGKTSALKQRRARILLKADAGRDGPAWTDRQIVESLDVGLSTVERTRRLYVEQGLEDSLKRQVRKTPPVPPILDGEKEAQLLALACGNPPEGHARWTLKLLADQMVVLEHVQSISYETVRRTLKKTPSNPISRSVGPSHLRTARSSSGGWKMS